MPAMPLNANKQKIHLKRCTCHASSLFVAIYMTVKHDVCQMFRVMVGSMKRQQLQSGSQELSGILSVHNTCTIAHKHMHTQTHTHTRRHCRLTYRHSHTRRQGKYFVCKIKCFKSHLKCVAASSEHPHPHPTPLLAA